MGLSIEELIEKNLSDMFSLAIHLTGSREMAEDLVQDLFVNLSTRGVSVDQVRNPRAWLAQILYRLFVDQWRKEQRSPMTVFSYSEDETREYWIDTVADNSPGPDAHLETDRDQRKLLMAMKFLNEEQRDLIILHDIEGYTLKEIETISGIALGTLKSRLHRGREKLQARLQSPAIHKLGKKPLSDENA